MRPVDHAPNRRIGSSCSFLGIWLTAVGLLVSSGCGHPSQPSAVTVASARPNADETLNSALEALRKGVDLESCRAALQQANVYLTHHENDRPRTLTAEERDVLKKDFGLE